MVLEQLLEILARVGGVTRLAARVVEQDVRLDRERVLALREWRNRTFGGRVIAERDLRARDQQLRSRAILAGDFAELGARRLVVACDQLVATAREIRVRNAGRAKYRQQRQRAPRSHLLESVRPRYPCQTRCLRRWYPPSVAEPSKEPATGSQGLYGSFRPVPQPAVL